MTSSRTSQFPLSTRSRALRLTSHISTVCENLSRHAWKPDAASSRSSHHHHNPTLPSSHTKGHNVHIERDDITAQGMILRVSNQGMKSYENNHVVCQCFSVTALPSRCAQSSAWNEGAFSRVRLPLSPP